MPLKLVTYLIKICLNSRFFITQNILEIKCSLWLRLITIFRSLSDLFRFFEAANHVANLSRLIEHFRSRFCGLASLSFNFMMDTELEEDVEESEEISGA